MGFGLHVLKHNRRWCTLSPARRFFPRMTSFARPYTMYTPVVDDSVHDNDQLIFGPIDLDDNLHNPSSMGIHWDPYSSQDMESTKSPFAFDTIPAYEYGPSEPSPTGSYYESHATFYNPDGVKNSPSLEDNLYMNWINDPDFSAPSPSSPISIPSPLDVTTQSSTTASSFSAFNDHSQFSPTDPLFSPSTFAALHPLPASVSPSSSFEDPHHPLRQRVSSLNPADMSVSKPTWASHLWDAPSSSLRTPHSLVRPSVRHSPLSDATVRQRVPLRRGSLSTSHPFQSSSLPSFTEPRAPSMTRGYSRRSESVVSIGGEDRDATVRRKKRSPGLEDREMAAEKPSDARKSQISPFALTERNSMTSCSDQVHVETSQVGPIGLAAVLYGLDPKAAAAGHAKA
jgi:hypothetical protein